MPDRQWRLFVVATAFALGLFYLLKSETALPTFLIGIRLELIASIPRIASEGSGSWSGSSSWPPCSPSSTCVVHNSSTSCASQSTGSWQALGGLASPSSVRNARYAAAIVSHACSVWDVHEGFRHAVEGDLHAKVAAALTPVPSSPGTPPVYFGVRPRGGMAGVWRVSSLTRWLRLRRASTRGLGGILSHAPRPKGMAMDLAPNRTRTTEGWRWKWQRPSRRCRRA